MREKAVRAIERATRYVAEGPPDLQSREELSRCRGVRYCGAPRLMWQTEEGA